MYITVWIHSLKNLDDKKKQNLHFSHFHTTKSGERSIINSLFFSLRNIKTDKFWIVLVYFITGPSIKVQTTHLYKSNLLAMENSEIHILEWIRATKLFGSVWGTLLFVAATCGFVSSVASYIFVTYRQKYEIKWPPWFFLKLR